MDRVFKGYIRGKTEDDGKAPATKLTSENFLPFEEAESHDCFGAVLNKGFIDISFDTEDLSNKFWDMAEENDWNCLILENPSNGHIHSYWKIPKGWEHKDGKDKKLAVGLVADIHSKGTYIPLKVHGVKRYPPQFIPEVIDEVPEELFPVKTHMNLSDLEEGDGRNDELFKYILVLQSQLSVSKETAIRILKNINDFVFKKPLDQKELDTITRDESFAKPLFYENSKFLHNNFGQYLKNEYHIVRINGQLHVYDNGVYKCGYRIIESKMIEVIPMLKASQRTEVLKYLEIIIPEDTDTAEPKYIPFKNGIYNIEENALIPFDPSIVVTNQIPWDYNEDAYSELCDNTLNKISCNDPEIRMLLEEAIGYSFFRQNEMSKSFILTGEGANGKSTFLDMLKNVLGRSNFVSLDIDELSDRFNTSSMSGKLACIGDDSNDDFLQGRQLSQFKKIVSGNDLKGENKGQDIFFFKPYTKLFFSFNELPRMRNKGFGALKRRLVIIPFDAHFSKEDPDYDPLITWKLKKKDVAEYLIQLGIDGLIRVLHNRNFTESQKVTDRVEGFEKDNNPILLFLEETDPEEIINQETKTVFLKYEMFCNHNGFQKMAMQTFTKEINKRLGCIRKEQRINGKKVSLFVKVGVVHESP